MNRINTAIILTATTLTAIYLTALNRATYQDRRKDSGMETLQVVIIAAGTVALAIGVIAYIGPVVTRYLSRIN